LLDKRKAWGAHLSREFKGKRHSLGEALTAELKEFCQRNDTVAAKVIRRAVREYLDRQKPQEMPAPPVTGRPRKK
jgi:hypothetical protein